MTDAYARLARYLDTLPASYPPTPDGVELRLLEHLFTPQEAELALHLSLISQDIPHISRQAGLSVEETSLLLAQMLKKGLINGSQSKDKGPTYSISQFVIGFYEGQVNQTLPRELLESAFIDGASNFTIFVKLILPLSVPALASFAIFQFLWLWNDYLVALVFLGEKNQTVTIAVAQLVGEKGQDWHLMTSAAFVSMILPLVVFLGLQRYFVRGLMAGSVKG